MLVASVISGISDAVTSAIGDYGLYAIFLLMLIDAVLPAASELVMVYGGALAAGAFANQDVTLFGRTIDEGLPAYVAVALAGTIGYTIGAIGGWAIGLYGGGPPHGGPPGGGAPKKNKQQNPPPGCFGGGVGSRPPSLGFVGGAGLRFP